MKYGDSALDGKSGMLTIFQQKRGLNLIGGLNGNSNPVKDFADDIDCIFLLANHDPDKSGLQAIIKAIEKINIPGVGIKYCTSNFMGYGLYKESVISIQEFNKRYAKQIYSKS